MTPAAFEFDIYPGDRLGPFILGSSLWVVLEYLRQQQTSFPQISVSFDNSAPAVSPVLLHIRPYVDLLFSPTQQRLHTISVNHIDIEPPLILRYNSKVLLSPDATFRRSDVSKVFGPTYAGSVMRYPGLSFSFDEEGASNHTKKVMNEDRSQQVRRLVLTQHSAHAISPAIDLDSIKMCPALDGELENAVFTIKQGAMLYFYTGQRSVNLLLGQTRSQDVLLKLGPPLRTHIKDDDRMVIHATQPLESPSKQVGYFYNYFQYGLDLFFSEATHTLLKIISHSNVPGSALFQRYQRCPWEIQGKSAAFFKESLPSITLSHNINDIVESGSTPFRMQVDRSEDPQVSLPGAITYLSGFDGIVFESTEIGDIVSFTLF